MTTDPFLKHEHDLRWGTFTKRDEFSSADARRHFNEGFVRRHYMLQSSRIFLRQHAQPERTKPLSPYEATECAIHLNAYYLNLRGALDNLAWTLQYEWQVLSGVSERVPRALKDCSLFAPRFLSALESRSPSLAAVLSQHCDWAKELAELRDPAAHRVPIYVPPSIITWQSQVDEFRRIEAQAELPEAERGGRSIGEIHQDAQAVGHFAPVMITSNGQGLEIRGIDVQIGRDHGTYLMVSGAVVDSL